jgi:type IV pilus assembly protein PilB
MLMASEHVRLGELLVEAQAITREQLAEILELQKQDGRRLGTLMVESGFVTEVQVTQILSQQLSIPWVSLYHIDFSRQLLDLVPRELADQYGLVPIFVRRVRGLGNTLYIAMDDPSDEVAIEAVKHYSGLPVRCMIAPPSDIRGAIRAYYHKDEELGPTSLPPPELLLPKPPRVSVKPAPEMALEGTGTQALPTAGAVPTIAGVPVAAGSVLAAPRAADSIANTVSKNSSPAPIASTTPDSGESISESSQHVPVREHSMPTPKRGPAHRRVTLTLLDGTKVTLPGRPANKAGTETHAEPDMSLTARDIVQALRAKLHGQNASEVLGEHDRWEGLFVALLSVLLKKHLIADWEFIDELKRL